MSCAHGFGALVAGWPDDPAQQPGPLAAQYATKDNSAPHSPARRDTSQELKLLTRLAPYERFSIQKNPMSDCY